MKKKLVLATVTLCLVALCTTVMFFVLFMSKSITSSEVMQFCLDNSTTEATSFSRFGISGFPQYAFWIATGNNEAQELFIFRKARFGFFSETNRFNFVNSVASDPSEIVSSVMFMPRDDSGEKMNTNLLVFFSSNTQSQSIASYSIVFEEDSDVCIREGGVGTDQWFVVSVSNLGTNNGMSRKFISADFFDRDGGLVDSTIR
ncbi:MAG: hypothetical protein FWC20_10175 [Oscillospiraceae bacterium]|nr:hypothetical protein [Oscillospiraceae bacterium]MCL2279754.1 hypothetical protein [Oscillospiraceae bacterium]